MMALLLSEIGKQCAQPIRAQSMGILQVRKAARSPVGRRYVRESSEGEQENKISNREYLNVIGFPGSYCSV